MILLKKKFLDLVRCGEKCQTIRLWPKRRLRPGQREYIPGLGRIRITAFQRVTPADLTDEDARLDGFASREALLAELRSLYGGRLDGPAAVPLESPPKGTKVLEGGGLAGPAGRRRRGDQAQPGDPAKRDPLKPVQVHEMPLGRVQPVPPGDQRQVQGVAQACSGPFERPSDGPRADAQQAGEFALAGPANVHQPQEVPLSERDHVEESAEVPLFDAQTAEFAAS